MKLSLFLLFLTSQASAFQVGHTVRRSSLLLQSTADESPSDVDTFANVGTAPVENVEKRSQLKRDLLGLGASYDRGFGASPSARTRVDDLISELEDLNESDTTAPASTGIDGTEPSPLAGSWRMIWTTASDVLVLGASPIATVGAIYQIFEPPVVTNVIDFIPRIQDLVNGTQITYDCTVKPKSSEGSSDDLALTVQNTTVRFYRAAVSNAWFGHNMA